MKLYTRQGDDGTTGLFGGTRVGKDHHRVCAYGEVDELNCSLGLAGAVCRDPQLLEKLRRLQADLFVVGSELANPQGQGATVAITEADIQQLERWIDSCSEAVEPLRSFILPGGGALAARLHYSRATCRRAERAVVVLTHTEPVRKEVLIYLNRLGDLLFAMARLANKLESIGDIPWQPR
ncbi:MAG: cob(I)yrinic acid a,c-diamide adenosyltransferase [Phycisphaerae bacterium]|nr:cob(I)yrinic acid a,c-diamide adenosyltransferase [Phycisphaerae bacterium]